MTGLELPSTNFHRKSSLFTKESSGSRSQDQHAVNLRSMASQAIQESGLINKTDLIDVTPMLGRNVSGIFTVSDRSYFVKVITGLYRESRFERSSSFFSGQLQLTDKVRTPQPVFTHESTYTVIYETIDDANSLSELAQVNEIPDSLLSRVGQAIAALHNTEPLVPERISTDRPGLPPVSNTAIPLDLVEGSTMGQLDLWRIIQSDIALGEGLSTLVTADFPLVPVHGDLRTDQIFHSPNDIWIIDWEDFHLGDPARDLGAVLGELLFHQLRQLVSQAADEHGEVTDDSIHYAGANLIEATRPSLQALWLGYSKESSLDESLRLDFRKRVLGYIGWQMFERTMAIGTYLGRITAFERALSGIGRNLILDNDAYSTVLGLD